MVATLAVSAITITIKLMGVGAIIAFVFGLLYGSFLNVVIVRFDDWLSIVRTPSHCPRCKTRLTWFDLIPVLSYLMLRGRCRYCAKPIAWQYPVVELATAALMAAGFIFIFEAHSLPLWQESLGFIGYLLALGLIVVIFFHDLYEMMIPDLLSNLLLGIAAVFSLVFYNDALGTIYAALIGFLPIALLVFPSGGSWMGEGDVKLATALTLLVGWPTALALMAIAFLSGGLVGLVGLISRQVKLKTAVPFAPFLIFAFLVSFFYGNEIVGWYFRLIGYGYY